LICGFVKISDDDERLTLSADYLVANRGAAMSTEVFVLVPFGKHEQQSLTHGHSSAALRAIQLCGVETAELPFLTRAPLWNVNLLHTALVHGCSWSLVNGLNNCFQNTLSMTSPNVKRRSKEFPGWILREFSKPAYQFT
jgi:hypothetical protein